MVAANPDRLLIVGNPDPVHVGAHLLAAARELGLAAELCDVRRAYAAPRPVVKLNWWLRGRRPPRLRQFSQEVAEACRRFRPAVMVATGLAPLDQLALHEIGRLGVARLNYLTDDPWNPAHRAGWFLQALPTYDQVFSPRRSNLDDLRQAGCRRSSYLPFAYAPALHFPEPVGREDEERLGSDVLFVGGADTDRVPYLAALVRRGLRVALYGGYWERYPETRPCARGHADPATLRKAAAAAKVALCLVRRANRDGHVMRSFETAAVGACMLAEDTPEHRAIFGEDAEAVRYFRDIEGVVGTAESLVADPAERRRLAGAVRDRVRGGANTYADRLAAMLREGVAQG